MLFKRIKIRMEIKFFKTLSFSSRQDR